LKRSRTHVGSYAAEIVERLYESYVEDVVDLRAEYGEFYADEYSEMPAFLYHKYGCTEDDLRALNNALQAGCHLDLVLRPWLEPFHTEEGNALIAEIIGAKWMAST